MTVRIAALLACHNRVKQTLACLESLAAQTGADARVEVVLLDAGSTDGTAEAVQNRFPEAVVLQGNADQFWNTGMHRAFAHAVASDFDYYLWLNDDTELDPHALRVLLETERILSDRGTPPSIVVGSTRDPQTGRLTYGGVRRASRVRPLRFQLVPPGAEPRPCQTMNGNCVLVPRAVVEAIGVLDPAFTHGIGDYDYGLRARQAGCSVWAAPGTVGTCARNASSAAPTMRQEAQRLRGPKGLPPTEWSRFARRWAGPMWPLYATSPYVRRLARALGSSLAQWLRCLRRGLTRG